MVRALRRNSASPSLSEMELTMHLPWAFLRPSSMVSQCEESIIMAAFAMAGSPAMWRRNTRIFSAGSTIGSSILMSMTDAPPSIWAAAMASASSYLFSEMSRANLREPATLVRSPMLVKLRLRSIRTGSKPLTVNVSLVSKLRGVRPFTASATARMCAGVVPQHPPAMFSWPRSASFLITPAIEEGESL